jgi:glyceraldehyde 3-phosphate dehydrogenase
VSVVDLTVQLRKNTTTDELRAVLKRASRTSLRGIMGCEERPLVSVDFKGNELSSIVDIEYVKVMQDNLAKIVTWYDNEWGYSCRVADLARFIARKGLPD